MTSMDPHAEIAEQRRRLAAREARRQEDKASLERREAEVIALKARMQEHDEWIALAKRAISYLEEIVGKHPTEPRQEIGEIGESEAAAVAERVPFPKHGKVTASTTPNPMTLDYADGAIRVHDVTKEIRKVVAEYLYDHGPTPTSKLVDVVESRGLTISGKDRIASLSAILSRTSFFKAKNRLWHLVSPEQDQGE